MKQRLQELAGISPASTQLARLIIKAIDSVSENLSYKDFAQAVAYILKQDYGTHNYEPFIRELKNNLDIDGE